MHITHADQFQSPPYDQTAIDKYRPSFGYPSTYEQRPISPPYEHTFDFDRYDAYPSPPALYRPQNYDRFDVVKPIDRPIYSEIAIFDDPQHTRPSGFSPPNDSGYDGPRRPSAPPSPPIAPPPSDYLGPYKPPMHDSFYPTTYNYRPKKPERPPPLHNYLDRERESPEYYNGNGNNKNSKTSSTPPFIPYTINRDASNDEPSPNGWPSYSNAYQTNQQANNFWGLPNDYKRNDVPFNYFNLGNGPKGNEDNTVLSYPGSRYDFDGKGQGYQADKDRDYYGNLWTRRPGPDGKTYIRFASSIVGISHNSSQEMKENPFKTIFSRVFGQK